MLKNYSKAEVDMIEAQIKTFRADFKRMSFKRNAYKGGLSSVTAVEKLLIPASELESMEVIGKGSFGEVHKSKYRGSLVAVKTLHEIKEEHLKR